MQKSLGISQEQFKDLMSLYNEKFIDHNSKSYWEFCQRLQKKVLKVLEEKFSQHGYKLVRVVDPPKEYNLRPGIYYKIVYAKEFFGLNVVNKYLSLTSLTRDIRLIDMNYTEEFPDVCIVSSDYLNNKIKTYVDKLFDDFKRMKPLL